MASETILRGWVTTSRLGSGYAALHMVEVQPLGAKSYVDVQSTGFGRYATAAEAWDEAVDWSVAEDLPLVPPALSQKGPTP